MRRKCQCACSRIGGKMEPTSRFAIVQWEDLYTSIINLENVKLPRKAIENYTEGEYITANFGKKAYRARISKIAEQRASLNAILKLPLSYPYESGGDTTEEYEPDCIFEPPTVKPAAVKPAAVKPVAVSSDEEPDCIFEPPTVKPAAVKPAAVKSAAITPVAVNSDEEPDCIFEPPTVKPAAVKPADIKPVAVSSDEAEASLDMSLLPGTPDCTQSNTVSALSRKLKRVERRLDELEKEVKKLKRKKKAESVTVTESDVQLEDLLECIGHLDVKNIGLSIKTLCFKLFTNEEILNSTRTGKKTAFSSSTKPPFNQKKNGIIANCNNEKVSNKFRGVQEKIR